MLRTFLIPMILQTTMLVTKRVNTSSSSSSCDIFGSFFFFLRILRFIYNSSASFRNIEFRFCILHVSAKCAEIVFSLIYHTLLADSDSGDQVEAWVVTKVMVICKWGGMLTATGERQVNRHHCAILSLKTGKCVQSVFLITTLLLFTLVSLLLIRLDAGCNHGKVVPHEYVSHGIW